MVSENQFHIFLILVHLRVQEPTIKHFKKVNKSVVWHFTFYLGHDDHRSVDFIGETIRFTFQLIKT